MWVSNLKLKKSRIDKNETKIHLRIKKIILKYFCEKNKRITHVLTILPAWSGLSVDL